MGLFDGLRDAATLRSYNAAVKTGDPAKVGAAAVVAVNRLGSEGLLRIDARQSDIPLNAAEHISRAKMQTPENLSAKSEIEEWISDQKSLSYSAGDKGFTYPLGLSKNLEDAERRHDVAGSLCKMESENADVWEAIRDQEGYRAVMFEAVPVSTSKLSGAVLNQAYWHSEDMDRTTIAEYPADERAAHPALQAILRGRLGVNDPEVSPAPSAPVGDVSAKDELLSSPAAEPKPMTFSEARTAISEMGYSLRKTGHGKEMRAAPKEGTKEEREDLAIYDDNADDIASTVRSEVAQTAARQTATSDARLDRTPEADAAFSRSAVPPSSEPDFRAALTAGTSGPARGPR